METNPDTKTTDSHGAQETWDSDLFPSIEVPQADTLSHVKRITAYVAEGHQSTEELTEALTRSGRSYGERQGQFYRRAAVQLGMLHENGKSFSVSSLGHTLIAAPDRPTELRAMRKGFLANPTLKSLYDFLAAQPAGRTRGEIAVWLSEHTTLSETSSRRRVSSVVNWMTEVGLAYLEGGRYGRVVPLTPGAQAIKAGRSQRALEVGQTGPKTAGEREPAEPRRAGSASRAGAAVSRVLRYFGLH